jgi:predicted nucleic acid-binding protein
MTGSCGQWTDGTPSAQEAKEKGKIKVVILNKEHRELAKKLREVYKLGLGEADAIALALP